VEKVGFENEKSVFNNGSGGGEKWRSGGNAKTAEGT
jgi:hypothetical protein